MIKFRRMFQDLRHTHLDIYIDIDKIPHLKYFMFIIRSQLHH